MAERHLEASISLDELLVYVTDVYLMFLKNNLKKNDLNKGRMYVNEIFAFLLIMILNQPEPEKATCI